MRRAIVRTHHDEADLVVAAIEPDNTEEITSRSTGATVETVVERETTGGLHTTLDDYLVNLQVAERTLEHERNETITTNEDTETRQ